VVKLDDQSFGYVKDLIDGADDLEMFEPFIKALKEYK
jgi:hypothetical protein